MAIKNTMEDNIKNYSKEIKTIESFVEAVRKTVGQYLGYTGNKGFINMIREIFQNSVDELMKDSSPCNRIKVFYNEMDHTVSIEDNGRGIPFDDIIRVFTSQHTSSNYVKKEGEFSSGRHGVGSKVTNAVSSSFIVESYILGEARRVEFYDGKPWSKGIQKIPNTKNKQGTIVTFKPSYEVMGSITTTYEEVLYLVLLILPLLKVGAKIDFEGIDRTGNTHEKHLVNTDGIITDLINKTTNPLIKPIIISKMTGTMKADIAFTYDSDNLSDENITAFSNFCPTISGTHVSGFIEGLTKFFREYMNKFYINKKSKLNVANNDIKTGLKCIVAVSHLEPIFTGQAKEILSNEDMFWFVRNNTLEMLDIWVKENPNDLKRLCNYFKEVAELRVKSDETKIILSKKYQASSLTGLPKKYIKPNGNKNLELIILEGDSALGSARNVKDNARQGLYPIRGKIPNAFSTTPKAFLENEEVAGILTLVGGGYGKKFDIDKVKWEKVILLPDADFDGYHIRSLLLRLFLMYCSPLIKAGRLYSAVPPLFGIKVSKNKYKYFTDKLEFICYTQTLFSNENVLKNSRGSKITVNEVIDILYHNMEYVYELNKIANTFAINPLLLENCIKYRKEKFPNFKRIIESIYRFISVDVINNSIVIKGLIGDSFNTVIFNNNLINSCEAIAKYVDNSPKSFIVNDVEVSLYELMKRFESFTPTGMTRYKGLGEMNDIQLKESVLSPYTDRTLLQFTIEDVNKEIEAVRYIESNKVELLKALNISKSDII